MSQGSNPKISIPINSQTTDISHATTPTTPVATRQFPLSPNGKNHPVKPVDPLLLGFLMQLNPLVKQENLSDKEVFKLFSKHANVLGENNLNEMEKCKHFILIFNNIDKASKTIKGLLKKLKDAKLSIDAEKGTLLFKKSSAHAQEQAQAQVQELLSRKRSLENQLSELSGSEKLSSLKLAALENQLNSIKKELRDSWPVNVFEQSFLDEHNPPISQEIFLSSAHTPAPTSQPMQSAAPEIIQSNEEKKLQSQLGEDKLLAEKIFVIKKYEKLKNESAAMARKFSRKEDEPELLSQNGPEILRLEKQFRKLVLQRREALEPKKEEFLTPKNVLLEELETLEEELRLKFATNYSAQLSEEIESQAKLLEQEKITLPDMELIWQEILDNKYPKDNKLLNGCHRLLFAISNIKKQIDWFDLSLAQNSKFQKVENEIIEWEEKSRRLNYALNPNDHFSSKLEEKLVFEMWLEICKAWLERCERYFEIGGNFTVEKYLTLEQTKKNLETQVASQQRIAGIISQREDAIQLELEQLNSQISNLDFSRMYEKVCREIDHTQKQIRDYENWNNNYEKIMETAKSFKEQFRPKIQTSKSSMTSLTVSTSRGFPRSFSTTNGTPGNYRTLKSATFSPGARNVAISPSSSFSSTIAHQPRSKSGVGDSTPKVAVASPTGSFESGRDLSGYFESDAKESLDYNSHSSSLFFRSSSSKFSTKPGSESDCDEDEYNPQEEHPLDPPDTESNLP